MKVKGKNKLTASQVKMFKKTLVDIKEFGISGYCPMRGPVDAVCPKCHQAFPKKGCACPCHSGYSTKYLIKRIKEIIKNRAI